jgi:DNA invertase Pin-like site-specific DNA recombinase
MKHADSRRPAASSQQDQPTPIPTPPRAPLCPSPKVQDKHLARLAIVYVRQSTPQQVLYHRESTQRQYALDQRALQLGWPVDRIEIVDDDQGQSGRDAQARLGFQSILARIVQDQVGIVLGLEMSRLARSNKDWHQLLETCAIFQTLLADQDGVYDPTDYNDRLLLGLKGTISEAELHILRTRMYEGMLNKARRGEIISHPPIGYVKSGSGRLDLDPDAQVQSVVRLLLEQFERLGTVSGLLRYLVREGIHVPVRPHYGEQRGQLVWRRPNRITLQTLLRHPVYAGFYRWGHRAVDPRRKVPGRPNSGRTVRLPQDCLVLLPDRCPAYITAERFQANQQRLSANRVSMATPGAPRRGPALLGGLLVCGRCGYRLMVNYSDNGRNLRYCCSRALTSYGEMECQTLSGKRLDALVAEQVLAVLQPPALELHLAAAEDVQAQRKVLHQNWQQQLQRAAYEVARASRQYQRVDPENRLVAAELERRWEEALREENRLQQEYEQFCLARPAQLTAAEREQIRQLACDIPALWRADTTTPEDRKRLVRMLIERIEVDVQGQTEQVKVAIHWSGGSVSRHDLVRTVQRYEQLTDYRRLCGRVEELRQQGKSMEEVAACLNAEGFHPPKRVERFTGGMVSGFWTRQCAKGAGRKSLACLLNKEEWLLGDLSRHLGIPQVTLHRWRKVGWVRARKLESSGGHWAIWASGSERSRLGQLRYYQKKNPNQPIPPELTTPGQPKRK